MTGLPLLNRREKRENFPGQRLVVLPEDAVARAGEDALIGHLYPTGAGYIPDAAKHLRERPSGVDQAVLLYCAKGAGWCEVRGRYHVVKESDLLVIPPGVPHAYGADEALPWTIYWFQANGSLLPNYLKELNVSPEKPVRNVADGMQITALFEELLGALEQGYALHQLLYSSSVLGHLMAVLVNAYHQSSGESLTPEQKVAKVIAHMNGHLSEALPLPSLARLAGLSPSRFNELFRTQTGYAPVDYLIRLRMLRACQLLDSTGMSIKAVAEKVGYKNFKNFTRLFKNVNGRPPSAYRKLRKG